MSSLYLRGNKVWIKYRDQHGITRQKSTGFVSESRKWPPVVVQFKKQFDARLALGRWDMIEPVGTMKLSEAFDAYMKDRGGTRAKGTRVGMKLVVDRTIDYFGDTQVHKITEADIFNFRAHLLREYTEQNAWKHLTSLGPLFTWLMVKGYIQKTPITKYTRITPRPREITVLTPEQIDKVFARVKGPMRNQWEFLRLTGFRVGESCALQWRDIDFPRQKIRVWNQKARRDEYVPMDTTLSDFLSKLPRKYEPWVFRYRHYMTVSHAMTDALTKEKLEGYKLHSLRAGFITQLIEAGASVSQIMEIGRLRSFVTAQKYYKAVNLNANREFLERSRGYKTATSAPESPPAVSETQ